MHKCEMNKGISFNLAVEDELFEDYLKKLTPTGKCST